MEAEEVIKNRAKEKRLKMKTKEKQLEKLAEIEERERRLEKKSAVLKVGCTSGTRRGYNLRIRASVERESIEARAQVQSSVSSQAGQKNAFALTKITGLRGFVDEKDNQNHCFLHFFRFIHHK